MSPRTRHLSDTRLLLLLEDGGTDPHLDACPECRNRIDAWRTLPSTVETAADDAFARALPEAHIAASRRRILEALDAQRGARIVAFPASTTTSPQEATPKAARRVPRWMAGVAAGLILGILLGRWTHPAARRSPVAAPSQAHIQATRPAMEPVRYASPSDDDFLRDLETLRSGPVAAVRTLHELTPQADAHDTLW